MSKEQYFLYVSRAENWSDRHNNSEIYKSEWVNYVKNDSDLNPISTDFDIVDYFGESIYWDKGEIYCNDPDEVAFYKMLEISNAINGIIYGGDGRVYTMINSYFYPVDTEYNTPPPLLRFEKDKINNNKPWWMRLLRIGLIS